jgi:uncharacterized protein (TIGR03086 family)
MAIDELHRQALDATAGIVRGIRVDQMGDPTPDDDWDVRTLLNHLIAGNFWAAELTSGKTIEEVGDRLDGDLVGNDPVAAWEPSAKAAAAAFEAPGALEAPCAVSYGPVPGSIYCGHRFIDVLIHGWDVATSTGQDTTLDAGLVQACIDVLEPQYDALRGSGAFATDVPVPDGGDPQTRLLAMLGRRP